MKFAAAVVLLACALGAHSSIIPIPLSYTAVQSPALVVAQPGSVDIQSTIQTLPAQVVAGPIVHAAQIIQPATAVIVPAAEGTYVAKTRGAVHVAPLPGHANSAASVNLEPAPGTL